MRRRGRTGSSSIPDSPFFRRVEVEVVIEAGRDYHVPLLLSPYACAIYRGS